MSRPHPALLRLAQGLIAAGVLLGVLAFAARAAPSFRGAALLNDGAIVLFVADLAFVLMPWRLTEP